MSNRPGRKAYLLISLFALALVLFPFLFWYLTWFGRPLTDSALDDYFHDKDKPRHAQHALVQLGERLSHGFDISRWYPNVLDQAASPNADLRQTAAWIMGQVKGYEPFHAALLRLIHDPEAMVRRNAALALSAYGDPAARPELIAMLRPYTVTAPRAGTLKYRLKLGDYVNPGTLIAHVGDVEVRTPVPGEVRSLEQKDGAGVKAGDALADLEDVQRYTHPVPNMPDTVERQAELTAKAIEARKP